MENEKWKMDTHFSYFMKNEKWVFIFHFSFPLKMENGNNGMYTDLLLQVVFSSRLLMGKQIPAILPTLRKKMALSVICGMVAWVSHNQSHQTAF